MRYLNLSFLLNSDIYYEELIDFVYIFDGVYRSEVPISQVFRVTSSVDASPCITGNSGDFIWYDTYSSTFVDVHTARAISRTSNPYDDKFPASYVIFIDDFVAQRCASFPAPILVATFFPHVPMVLAPVPVVVPYSKRDLSAVRTLLEQTDISV